MWIKDVDGGLINSKCILRIKLEYNPPRVLAITKTTFFVLLQETTMDEAISCVDVLQGLLNSPDPSLATINKRMIDKC